MNSPVQVTFASRTASPFPSFPQSTTALATTLPNPTPLTTKLIFNSLFLQVSLSSYVHPKLYPTLPSKKAPNICHFNSPERFHRSLTLQLHIAIHQNQILIYYIPHSLARHVHSFRVDSPCTHHSTNHYQTCTHLNAYQNYKTLSTPLYFWITLYVTHHSVRVTNWTTYRSLLSTAYFRNQVRIPKKRVQFLLEPISHAFWNPQKLISSVQYRDIRVQHCMSVADRLCLKKKKERKKKHACGSATPPILLPLPCSPAAPSAPPYFICLKNVFLFKHSHLKLWRYMHYCLCMNIKISSQQVYLEQKQSKSTNEFVFQICEAAAQYVT